MRLLYHIPLCPFSRKVRLVLNEKGLDHQLQVEKVWERRDAFLALNPAGQVPVLVEGDDSATGPVLAESLAIAEYLEEIAPTPALMGATPAHRAEVRRLVLWFDLKFDRDVTRNLVGEKIMKRFLGLGAPNSAAIRAGHANLPIHLNYISYLVERRSWLAGDQMSLADVAAAAHLSCIDYIGDIPWEKYELAKNWYARIKSRPSFRPILADHIAGMPPPKHYADLDF
ncbi:MAG: glutathione S-transferase [Alphaproteobacteria bacterium]|jgi:glutathione S-transferase